ncbi:hypothetical protein NCC49_003663 [Naganishia albida]|nr:hypothetical protein NCC49_003663 [Naganishia albida]
MVPLSSLALPRFLHSALVAAGYNSLDDLDGVHPNELARDLKITLEAASDVLRQADYRRAGPSSLRPRSQLPASQSQSAASLLRRDTPAARQSERPTPTAWSTGSRAIDHLLLPPPFVPRRADDEETRGGVRQGMVLEVAAPPGVGKTSLLLRVAMSARTSPQAPEVLLVDTEGGLSPPKLGRAATGFPAEVLDGIHLVRPLTQPEMIAFWHTLEDWLVAHPKVKLICVDTLSFFFRNPALDLGTKKRLLDMVKQKIAKASTVYSCAILIANQMATKLLTADNKPAATFDSGDRAILMPQLGDLWVTPRTLRLSLFRSGPGTGKRYAHVQAQAGEKGERPWAAFEIDEHGLVVDVPVEKRDAEQE